jgi:hypothetical protein
VLANFVTGSWGGAFIQGIILWGLVTFQVWGYWIVMVFGTLGLLGSVLTLGRSPIESAIALALSVFILIVLYTRRDYFD